MNWIHSKLFDCFFFNRMSEKKYSIECGPENKQTTDQVKNSPCSTECHVCKVPVQSFGVFSLFFFVSHSGNERNVRG